MKLTNTTEKPVIVWDDTTLLRELMEQQREKYHNDEYRRLILGEWYTPNVEDQYPDKPDTTADVAEMWEKLRDNLSEMRMPKVITATAPTHQPFVSDIIVGLTSVYPIRSTHQFTVLKERPIGLVNITELIA